MEQGQSPLAAMAEVCAIKANHFPVKGIPPGKKE
jgi:hypothetical protein